MASKSTLNLVSDTAMLEAATVLRDAVVALAPTNRIRQSVYISRVEGKGGSRFITVAVNMNKDTGAPEARAFDLGSGLHGKLKAKYIIAPRNGRALAFLWPKANPPFKRGKKLRGVLPDGRLAFNYVEHPGVKGTGYMKQAVNESKKEVRDLMAKSAVGNFRAYIRSQFTDLKR